MQYFFVLMQPPVFPVLEALAVEAAQDSGIKNLTVHCINERLEKGDDYLQHIIAEKMTAGANLVFLSAKSFELPRAIDIARLLKATRLQVVIGGTGPTLADWKTYQYLVNQGVSFNVGEGELTVRQIIKDALADKLKLAYWQKEYVNLRKAPLPVSPRREDYCRSLTKYAAIGTSEGCPFNCSFCCVTTLRGRKICPERSREPGAVIEWIERTLRNTGLSIMLTDDNFRRSYSYPELKKGLIKLNEKLDGKLYFFVQLDASQDVIAEAADLSKIGVKQAFFGFESLDSEILAGIAKKHNRPGLYRAIVDAFHKFDITVNAGLMVGFPNQTPASILAETQAFSELVDLAHIYAVTPFPGSRDYTETVSRDELLTHDLNFYDTAHCVRDWFQNMTPAEAEMAYRESFSRFFTVRHLWTNKLRGELWRRNLKHTIYGRALAEWGKFRGRPLHLMMEGPPRRTRVWRPRDGFRGFTLTQEDLEKRELFLRSLTE